MDKFHEMKELEIDELEERQCNQKEYAKKLHNDIHERVHNNLKKGIRI